MSNEAYNINSIKILFDFITKLKLMKNGKPMLKIVKIYYEILKNEE